MLLLHSFLFARVELLEHTQGPNQLIGIVRNECFPITHAVMHHIWNTAAGMFPTFERGCFDAEPPPDKLLCCWCSHAGAALLFLARLNVRAGRILSPNGYGYKILTYKTSRWLIK